MSDTNHLLAMKKSKILILDDERGGIQHLNDALSPKHNLTWCRNIKDAMVMLDKPDIDFDLIICGTHLLYESIFDFLRQVRAKAQNKEIPFVCFRVATTQFADNMDVNIEKSARLLGANGYIAVEEYGDPEVLLRTVESKIGSLLPQLRASS